MYFREQASALRLAALQRVVLLAALLFTLGCGSSNNYAYTGTDGAENGSLTFNFIKAQAALSVPQSTINLHFEFFNGPNGTGNASQTAQTWPFAPQITISPVSITTKSVKITAFNTEGELLQTALVNVTVVAGQDTTVDLSKAIVTLVPPAGPGPLARLEVTPLSATLLPGETATFTAAGFDAQDQAISIAAGDLNVSIGDPAVATVASDSATSYTITAQQVGNTQINLSSANNSSISASFNLTVASGLAVNFAQGYTVGSINSQNGWKVTNASFDQGIVELPRSEEAFAIFGPKVWRFSNAHTTGSFGDQPFAPLLPDSVGESSATAGTFDKGTLYNHFEASFDFGTTKLDHQPGLALSLSPDRGDGSRMSYLQLVDEADGLKVVFYDVQGMSGGSPNAANFVDKTVATRLSRAVPHNIRLTFTAVEGESNDIVEVYIDGQLVHTGTSWEDYYLHDPEATAEQTRRIVKTLIFRSSGTAANGNSGQGFIFGNLRYFTSNVTI